MPGRFWTSPRTGKTYDTLSDDGTGRWQEATPVDILFHRDRRWMTKQDLQDERDRFLLGVTLVGGTATFLASMSLAMVLMIVAFPFLFVVAIAQWPLLFVLILATAVVCMLLPSVRAVAGAKPVMIVVGALPFGLLQLFSVWVHGRSHHDIPEGLDPRPNPAWLEGYYTFAHYPWVVLVAVALIVMAVARGWSRHFITAGGLLAVFSVLIWVSGQALDQVVAACAMALVVPLVLWLVLARRAKKGGLG